MDFRNRLKGSITQTLVQTLLDDAGYHVVPLGIEEVVREVKILDAPAYADLNLSETLRTLPDFFVATPELDKSWMVEVKFRRRWDESVAERLAAALLPQVSLWEPLYIVLFLGESFAGSEQGAEYPAFNLRVLEASLVDGGVCVGQTVQNGFEPPHDLELPLEKANLEWCPAFQEVFTKVAGRWQDETLMKTLQILRGVQGL